MSGPFLTLDPLGVNFVLFLAVAALGSYVQTVTGFALGLVFMGGVAALDLMPLTLGAVVISLLGLGNTVLALRRNTGNVAWRLVAVTAVFVAPSTLAGLRLLDGWAADRLGLLRLLLGGVILACSLVFIIRPPMLRKVSGLPVFAGFALLAGLVGGLFATYGPPLVFNLYRQPLPIATIRDTLLAIFAVTSFLRVTLLSVNGQLDSEAIALWALATPVVVLFTWLGRRFPPPLAPAVLRRGVFGLLLLTGVTLIVT